MNVFDRPLNHSSKLFAQKIVLTSENKRFIQFVFVSGNLEIQKVSSFNLKKDPLLHYLSKTFPTF